MSQKIFIFDGISGVPMAKELYQAFSELLGDASYLDNTKFPTKNFYDLRSPIAKLRHKVRDKKGFYYLPKLREREVAQSLIKGQPDILLVVGFIYKFVSPQFLFDLKQRLNFKLYLFDTDSCNLYSKTREFTYFLTDELPIYDKVFSFSKVTSDFFCESQGLNAEHMPFGAQEIQIETREKVNDIFFVGSADLRRIFILERLKEFNLKVYGTKWERHRKMISHDLMTKIVQKPIWGQDLYNEIFSSKILLNITRDSFYGVETGLNLRIFEALAAGAFLLTDYCEELESVLKVGEEIESYRCASELQDKVNFYLHNDSARERIAKKGHEHFLKDYTWKKRVKVLINKFN